MTELAIENGAIRGVELTADLRGAQGGATFNGDLAGRFFGPGAVEVGGVLDGTYTDAQVANVVHGWFGGEKQ